MKVKPKIIRALAERLLELGIKADETFPDVEIGKLAAGKLLMIVTVGPDLCNCCGKPVYRVVFRKPLKKPLEQIWR